METLLKMIHVSDFHVGKRSFIYGLQGHDEVARSALANLLHGENDLDDAGMIFTGDLTALGRQSEFRRGRETLSRLLPRRRPRAEFLEYAIPGNHDRWNGGPPVRGGRYLQPQKHHGARMFKTEELRRAPLSPEHGIHVDVIAVDSDSEVFFPERVDRWRAILACGECAEQADRLSANSSQSAGERKGLRILIILIHHSPSFISKLRRFWSGTQALFDGAPPPQEIGPRSQEALERLMRSADVAVVLSGHIHTPAIVPLAQSFKDCTGWEFRCGSTLQNGGAGRLGREIDDSIERLVDEQLRDMPAQYQLVLSPTMKSHFTEIARLAQVPRGHCFFVHRLCRRDDDWFWLVDLLGFTENGWQPLGRPWRVGEPLLAPATTASVGGEFPRAHRLGVRR